MPSDLEDTLYTTAKSTMKCDIGCGSSLEVRSVDHVTDQGPDDVTPRVTISGHIKAIMNLPITFIRPIHFKLLSTAFKVGASTTAKDIDPNCQLESNVAVMGNGYISFTLEDDISRFQLCDTLNGCGWKLASTHCSSTGRTNEIALYEKWVVSSSKSKKRSPRD